MVQIQRSEKKSVYRYLLQEGVIVLHKDFTNEPHKGTNVPNIHVRKLLRSLKDRGFLDLIFSWQTYYYLLNNEGKKHLSEELNLTEEVLPLTWKYISSYLEKTKRDSTNTLSMRTGKRLEENVNPEPPEENAEVEEEVPEARDVKEEKTPLLPPLNPKHQPQPDRMSPISKQLSYPICI